MKGGGAVFTRRDFLRGTTYATVAAVLAKQGVIQAQPESHTRSRVVLVRHPNALDASQRPNAEVIQYMLDEGVKALLQIDDTGEAWRRLIKPDDLVGIKSNAWTPLPTPKEVELAIQGRILDLGVREEKVRIDDRGARETLADCTALINARPLRTHHWAGIGGCLKNYIMFVSLPFTYHANACQKLGKIWTLPMVRDKTRLNVLVALRPLFHGRGPHHYSPEHVWDYRGMILSADPVAADAVGLRLLSAKRRDYFGEDKPLATQAHHVMYADVQYHVGVSDPDRIDLMKLGWMDGALI